MADSPIQARGYGDAIKAMEVATIPVVCPGNPQGNSGA
jgi:hypothetical protein